jgi:hypothetical protein
MQINKTLVGRGEGHRQQDQNNGDSQPQKPAQ